MNRDSLLNATLVAAAVGLVSVPFFGFLSDVIGRRLMYGIGIVGHRASSPFRTSACSNTRQYGLVLLAIVLSLVFHDMQYGPQAALIAESFGANIRYSGAGIGYQLASVIAGGPGAADRRGHPEEHRLEHRHQLVHHPAAASSPSWRCC